MPKLVNHNEKRRKLAEATWRIISRDGLEAVSVRRIAEETNISLGALRHYFKSQTELIEFSIRLISERIHERLSIIQFTEDPKRYLLNIICEILPIDTERRIEGEVWLAFNGRAIYDKDIRKLRTQVHEELHNCFCRIIRYLQEKNLIKEGINQEFEVERLHAMVDGLCIHNLVHPDMTSVDEMVSIVQYHLDQIIKPVKQPDD